MNEILDSELPKKNEVNETVPAESSSSVSEQADVQAMENSSTENQQPDEEVKKDNLETNQEVDNQKNANDSTESKSSDCVCIFD